MSMSISQKDAYGMVFSNYPDIVSVAQMSKMLGISEKSAYRLLQENSIEHFRVAFYVLEAYEIYQQVQQAA